MSRKRMLRRRANAIAEQDGRCFFCGEPMLPPDALDKGKPHPKAATLDHLNPRLSEGRTPRGPNQVKIVLPTGRKARNVASCRECNGKRNDEFQSALPLDLLQAQSGKGVLK